jgi:biotin carboxyl carrier protein
MNLERVEALLKLLQRQQHVGTLSVEGEGWRLHARRGNIIPMVPVAEPSVEAETEPEVDRHVVRALAVGIYRAPDMPVRSGDFISEGKQLGDIDSMRILNSVTTEHSGYVAEALVEDGDPVEYGQQLFVISPEPPNGDAPA